MKGEHTLREQLRDLHDPTPGDILQGALYIQDDVSFFSWRDAAIKQGFSEFDVQYQSLCSQLGFGPDGAIAGTSPARVHNVAENNVWGYKAGDPNFVPGIPCTFDLVWSGFLFQSQIDALNRCVPLEAVLVAGGVFKETLRAIAEKISGEKS